MPTTTILDQNKKSKIFEALQKISPEVIRPALITAALNNEIFPVDNKDFCDLCNLHARIDIAGVKLHLSHSISEFIDQKIAEEFQTLLSVEFDADRWQSNFLIFLASALQIEIQTQSMVQLTIQTGKVYWRIVNGEQVLYDRTARYTQMIPFDFNSGPTVSMTWEQFRLFKDSGKRGSSVSITQPLFVKEFISVSNPLQTWTASSIWDELKQHNILDHNNRISSKWRFMSSTALSLNNPSYPLISLTLNKICANPENGEVIPGAPTKLYRPDRSPKDWKKTALIQNLKPKDKAHEVRPWDVSIYRDLQAHALAGDNLDHDHIPSSYCLNKLKKSYMDSFHSLANAQNQTTWHLVDYYNQQANALNRENKDEWWCVAVPTSLHKQGLTHGECGSAQQEKIKIPFYDEVKDYLDKLELQWQNAPTPDDEYLKALGAFRYMYRSQIKNQHGLTPHRFFYESTNKPDIDSLLNERLKRFMVRKEGDTKVPYMGESPSLI